MARDKSKFLADGWSSLFSSYNSRRANKAEVNYTDNTNFLSDDDCRALWQHDGMSKRIVTCIAGDMVNKDFTLIGDAANITHSEMERLNVIGNLYEALCKSEVYGGSAILMGINDGRPMSSPVAVNSIKSIDF